MRTFCIWLRNWIVIMKDWVNNKVGASPVAYRAVGEVPTTRRRLHRCSFSHGLFREPYQVSSARAFRRASTANRLNDNFKALIVKDENIFPNGITEKKPLWFVAQRIRPCKEEWADFHQLGAETKSNREMLQDAWYWDPLINLQFHKPFDTSSSQYWQHGVGFVEGLQKELMIE